ncbi:hypothetical protein [Arhodomonas sp. AD133]|uniref:hypothetical protein n=1 Tax=Arhodomonas sp. AD133 TaxID=3415009 RepID=UPI003EB9CABF
MNAVAGAVLLVAGCLALMRAFGVVACAQDALTCSRSAYRVLSDPSLSDEVKERVLRGYAKLLLGLFATLATAGFGALVLPLSVVWALDRLGLLRLSEVLDVAASWWFVLAVSGAALAALAIQRKGAS